jgi:hypothetical protein
MRKWVVVMVVAWGPVSACETGPPQQLAESQQWPSGGALWPAGTRHGALLAVRGGEGQGVSVLGFDPETGNAVFARQAAFANLEPIEMQSDAELAALAKQSGQPSCAVTVEIDDVLDASLGAKEKRNAVPVESASAGMGGQCIRIGGMIPTCDKFPAGYGPACGKRLTVEGVNGVVSYAGGDAVKDGCAALAQALGATGTLAGEGPPPADGRLWLADTVQAGLVSFAYEDKLISVGVDGNWPRVDFVHRGSVAEGAAFRARSDSEILELANSARLCTVHALFKLRSFGPTGIGAIQPAPTAGESPAIPLDVDAVRLTYP